MASRAVVIGPWRYAEGSGLDSHIQIRNSALKYGEVLAADGRWGADRVDVLAGDSPVSGSPQISVDDAMTVVERAADEARQGDTLLVIYVGHGKSWPDIPDRDVHFAVESSHDDKPYLWLSSWYVYRAIRRSRATLKVLIADCCYSNELERLGGREGGPPGMPGEFSQGSCVFMADGHRDVVSPIGCPRLEEPDLRECTPFSGHLLSVLRRGTTTHHDELTLGVIREAVRADMADCGAHGIPDMVLRGGQESTPLFTNRMVPARRNPRPSAPSSAAQWVTALKRDGDYRLDSLFGDLRMAGQVYRLLSADPESQGIAVSISEYATQRLQEPGLFARYWSEARRALPV